MGSWGGDCRMHGSVESHYRDFCQISTALAGFVFLPFISYEVPLPDFSTHAFVSIFSKCEEHPFDTRGQQAPANALPLPTFSAY